jgi:hypothetical protein
VALKFRNFISAIFVVALMAGGIPSLACGPVACAASIECAPVHGDCCGPNCSWPSGSHESHKRDACNQRCPLISAGKPTTISQAKPIASAMFGVGEVQPFFLAFTHTYIPLGQAPDISHSSTLLSLGCALTI